MALFYSYKTGYQCKFSIPLNCTKRTTIICYGHVPKKYDTIDLQYLAFLRSDTENLFQSNILCKINI